MWSKCYSQFYLRPLSAISIKKTLLHFSASFFIMLFERSCQTFFSLQSHFIGLSLQNQNYWPIFRRFHNVSMRRCAAQSALLFHSNSVPCPSNNSPTIRLIRLIPTSSANFERHTFTHWTTSNNDAICDCFRFLFNLLKGEGVSLFWIDKLITKFQIRWKFQVLLNFFFISRTNYDKLKNIKSQEMIF